MNLGPAVFDILWWRYSVCGALLGIYLLVAWLAGRHVPREAAADVRVALPLRVLNGFTMVAFYWLVHHDGRAVWNGWGNVTGVGVALGATGFRWAARRGREGFRYPGSMARLLFEAALPLAMGTAWGWLVLTTPACLVAAWSARREARRARPPQT